MATRMVDTNVYSYLTGSNKAYSDLYRPHLEGHIIALSFATVGEQYAGYLLEIGRGNWPFSKLHKLEQLLQSVVVVPYDIEVCKTFGELRTLKNPDGSARTIESNDLWIAACAKRHSLTLVTHNRRHFQNIPGLNIIYEDPIPAGKRTT